MRAVAKIIFVQLIFLSSQKSIAVTWSDIRSAAIASNPNLKKSTLAVDKSREDILSQKSGFYPSLKATLSKSKSFDYDPAASVTSNRVGLTASQNLFAGFTDAKAVEKAEFTLKANVATLRYNSAVQRSKLRGLFDRGLYLQESNLFSKRAVARRAENVRIVQLRYDGGRENKGSVLATEVSKMQAEADLKNTELSLELVRLETSQLTGLQLSDSTSFEGRLDDAPVEPLKDQDSHPKVIKAIATKEASRAAVAEARSGWFPELSADASAFRSGMDAKIDPENHFAVGLTLSVPLFTPSQSHRYRDANIGLAQAEIEASEIRSEVILEIKKAQAQLENTRVQLDVAKKDLEASELQAEVYRQRYTLGMVSFQDWDMAESVFIKSDRELLAAKYAVATARTGLEYALGRTLEDKEL